MEISARGFFGNGNAVRRRAGDGVGDVARRRVEKRRATIRGGGDRVDDSRGRRRARRARTTRGGVRGRRRRGRVATRKPRRRVDVLESAAFQWEDDDRASLLSTREVNAAAFSARLVATSERAWRPSREAYAETYASGATTHPDRDPVGALHALADDPATVQAALVAAAELASSPPPNSRASRVRFGADPDASSRDATLLADHLAGFLRRLAESSGPLARRARRARRFAPPSPPRRGREKTFAPRGARCFGRRRSARDPPSSDRGCGRLCAPCPRR